MVMTSQASDLITVECGEEEVCGDRDELNGERFISGSCD